MYPYYDPIPDYLDYYSACFHEIERNYPSKP